MGGNGFYIFFTAPDNKEMTSNTKNIQKMILAIAAAPAAMPPNPKTPAIIATMKKIRA
jgi:hypothetical protein